MLQRRRRLPPATPRGFELRPTREIFRSSFSAFSSIVVAFCENTTLHGLKYIAAKNVSTLSKVFWFGAFTVSLATCCLFIGNVWDKWRESPVIFTFAASQTPISEFAFPAITVCNERRIRFKDSQNLTEQERFIKENRKYAALICPYSDQDDEDDDNDDDDIDVDTLHKFLQETAYTTNFTLINVSTFMGQNLHHASFWPVVTEDGLCMTFNMMPLHLIFTDAVSYLKQGTDVESTNEFDWSPEEGYKTVDSNHKSPYPRSLSQIGPENGLVLWLNVDTRGPDLCDSQYLGFKIIFHSPMEYPRSSQNFVRVPLNHQTDVGMEAKVITSDQSLMSISVQKRHCYFATERTLRFFTKYSRKNCQMECLSNRTMDICNCTAFFLPRTSGMPICTASKASCYNSIESVMLQEELSSGNKESKVPCDCLPGCAEINYSVETNTYPRNKGLMIFIGLGLIATPERISKDYATVTFFFKEKQFLGYRRGELYTVTDFIASCGGLLGLFLGFSMFSLVEIVYFLIMKAISYQNKSPLPSTKALMNIYVSTIVQRQQHQGRQ